MWILNIHFFYYHCICVSFMNYCIIHYAANWKWFFVNSCSSVPSLRPSPLTVWLNQDLSCPDPGDPYSKWNYCSYLKSGEIDLRGFDIKPDISYFISLHYLWYHRLILLFQPSWNKLNIQNYKAVLSFKWLLSTVCNRL